MNVAVSGTDLIQSQSWTRATKPNDEYRSYVARTAKLLMEGADALKVADYVRKVLRSLGISEIPEEKILEFARQLARHSA